MGRLTSQSGGRLTTKKQDLTTLDGLRAYAEAAGLGEEVSKIIDKKPKLSVLQRLSKGLGAFNPAEAVLTGVEEKSLAKGAFEYGKNIVQGIGSAITGTDYEQDRRAFKDVAEKMGIENGIAKFGIGFIGDVLLDPTTYFGGAIARGIGKTIANSGRVALKGVGKVAPGADDALRLFKTNIDDAFGKAFQYGYKSTKGAKDDVLSFLSSKQKANLGLASDNLNRLGTGVLTKEQSQELALKLVAGKRAEFVAREAGKTATEAAEVGMRTALKGTSDDVAKLIAEQSARSKEFAKMAGVETPYETYFPFLRKDKVQKFINDTYGIKVGSEGYKKQFKNLLTNENMELNPAKAFFTRESQIVSNKMTRDFLSDFAGKYGKKLVDFKNSDDAAKAGYQLIKDKGVFGSPVGYLKEWDAKLLKDSIDPGFQAINQLAKATGFDAITSLFKRSVTGLFAPFHVRNFVSGQIQNFEVLGAKAIDPKNIAIGQKIAYLMGKGDNIPDAIIQLGKESKSLREVMEPFVKRFADDTFYNADFDMALKQGSELKKAAKLFSKTRLKETVKTAGLGTEAIPFKVARGVGQFIEHGQKATAYVTALGKGMGIDDALRIAEKAGFDYRALTSFESQIMRRIVPFYSFTRKNIELQLKTLGENPQRINQVLSFFENIGETISPEEKEKLPNFIKQALGVKLGKTPEGLTKYISSFGTPIEAFTQLFSENPVLNAISQMNPLIKVPIEIGMGKDSFRQTDLKDTYDAKEYKGAPQIIKNILDIKEVQKDVLEKTSSGKLVKKGEKTVYVADPVRLLIARSLFTSRGVTYLDSVFGNDIQGFAKFLKTTTGLKAYPLDIEQSASIQERETERDVEDLLLKMQKVKKLEKVYVPKK
jgi:hypothetical protein